MHHEPLFMHPHSPGRSVAERKDKHGDLFVWNSCFLVMKRHPWALCGSIWFFLSLATSKDMAFMTRRKNLWDKLAARLTTARTPCLPFTAYTIQTWRKEFDPSCEWFSLELGALDTSSSLAWIIIVKVLLTILIVRTYLSLIVNQEQSYNTWIFLDMNHTHVSLCIQTVFSTSLYLQYTFKHSNTLSNPREGIERP